MDITRGSTDVTVSRCRFSRHDKTMLVGADPSHTGDRGIRVTVHHCFFDGTRQRHPRVRFGRAHLYNNYTRGWGIYAVAAGVEAQVASQCNVYEAGAERKAVFRYVPERAADREEAEAGWVRSEGDAFLNGARPCLVDGGDAAVFRPEEYYERWTMEAASPALKEVVQLCAGWQPVPRPPGE